ncbi:UNKNOWN [Stylonychia lemnae]|uniref:RING-type domain-containing protein n=1 Tax=Stylonychia lemnae TaxID=5949 RepID=A0A078AX23_STYLE|nr:UNKNOWN [Stylonychia lemnae]|eukprot:CDW85802.1 UNKNOWN [Stylonychia lemnae]
MAYTAFNSLITLCSHTYIKSWILGLYGIETQEKQEETQSATQSITHTNSNLPQQTNSLQNETSRTNQRAELREEMLDLEKKEFTQKMNFNVKIPSMLVKLSNTYYAKLSVFIKNLVFDGNQVNLEGNNTQSKKKKSRKLKDIRQVNDQVQQMEQDQIRDPNQQERMVIKKKKDELIFDKFDKLPKFTSCNNLLTDQGLADILSLVLDKDYNQEVNKNNPDVNSNGLNNNITNNYQSSKLRHKKVRSRSFTSIDEINQKLEYPRRTIEKKHKRNSNDDIVNNLNLNREARESNTGMSNQCLICCDKIADSVIMDCGHGGVCFDCAIQLCINAYTHNLIVAQKLIENRHRNRNPNLQMKESSCHICRQHISQIYQLETECPIANEKFADEDENQYLRVKDFFINEREFIIYYQYQKKLNEEMVPEEDSSVNLDNSMNLFVLRANDSPNHASRGQLAKYSRVLQSDIDKVIEKIADERRKLAKRFESIEQRAGQLQQESFAVNSSFTLGNSLHRLQESNNQPENSKTSFHIQQCYDAISKYTQSLLFKHISNQTYQFGCCGVSPKVFPEGQRSLNITPRLGIWDLRRTPPFRFAATGASESTQPSLPLIYDDKASNADCLVTLVLLWGPSFSDAVLISLRLIINSSYFGSYNTQLHMGGTQQHQKFNHDSENSQYSHFQLENYGSSSTSTNQIQQHLEGMKIGSQNIIDGNSSTYSSSTDNEIYQEIEQKQHQSHQYNINQHMLHNNGSANGQNTTQGSQMNENSNNGYNPQKYLMPERLVSNEDQQQTFDQTQEINIEQMMRKTAQQKKSIQQFQNQSLEGPITIKDLNKPRVNIDKRSSSQHSFELQIPPIQTNQHHQQSLINLTQQTLNPLANQNHSSSLLLNSSLLSHSQSIQLPLQQYNQNGNSTTMQYSQCFPLQNTSQSSNQHQNLSNSQVQNSQAIAGAMKALQHKMKQLEDQNELLVQQNNDLKGQLRYQIEKNQKEKEKFGEIMIKQKASHQHLEKESKQRIEDDLKQVGELRQRVEQSSRAIDKMMKENIGLRKLNTQLEKQLGIQEQENQKKVITTMQEMREVERNLKKKCKKLSKEKKECQIQIKVLHEENQKQKTYFSQLIQDLEMKLKELISQNHNLNNEYNSYRDQNERQIQHTHQELQEMKQLLSQGQYQVESKDSENQQLKIQLQIFQEEIQTIKQQLFSLQTVQKNNEKVREKTETFVQEVVNVNEMLVQSIQQRKIEKQNRRSSQHNQSQISNSMIPDQLTPLTTQSNLPSYRNQTESSFQNQTRNQANINQQYQLDHNRSESSQKSNQSQNLQQFQHRYPSSNLTMMNQSQNINPNQSYYQHQNHQNKQSQNLQHHQLIDTRLMLNNQKFSHNPHIKALQPIQNTITTSRSTDEMNTINDQNQVQTEESNKSFNRQSIGNNQEKSEFQLESEMIKFNQRYDALLKDIEASKMPINIRASNNYN